MDLEIRHPDPSDLDAIFDVRAQAFAVPDTDRERWTGMVDPSGMLTAFLDGRVVGSLTVLEAGQWLGGRSVPLGALATVVVPPELRGRGIGARLLAASLEHMHERGLAVSTLHPATTRAYRAAGWEIGGDFAIVTVPTRSLERLHPGEPERLVRLDREDWTLVQSCYDAAAVSAHGWVNRSDPWWDRVATERFGDHRFLYGVEGVDGLAGYAAYHQEPATWGYRLIVDEVVSLTAVAAATLWSFLGRHAMQVEQVTFVGGALEPLLLALPEQDIRVRANNRWMHRLVDARAAVAARGYPPAVRADVHLEIADRLAPWNAGRFELRVEDGRGELVPGGTGDVQVTVNALGALSTGWASANALAAAGALHRAIDVDRQALDAIFAGPRPSLLDDF